MNKKTLCELGFDPARLARVEPAAHADVESGLCDGVALVAGRHGRIALDLRVGFAERATGRPLDRDAVFVSMSIGKQFTNVLALACVERGALSLSTRVADVLPAFAHGDHARITLHQLLTHTSGIVSAIPPVLPDVLLSIEKLAAFAAETPLESAPGESVIYSIAVGHSVIAAMLLARAGGGRSFAQMLEEELFAPLGMRETSLGLRDDLVARTCPVVARYTEPGLFDPKEMEDMGQILLSQPGAEMPAGGFLTTAGDVHRFAEMLRCGGELDGVRILSPAMLDLATRNQTGERPNSLYEYTRALRGWDPFPAYLGIGFFLRGEVVVPGPFGALNSPRTFGGIGAGSTCFWVDPARDLSFTLLTTGLLENSHHIERCARFADLVVSSIVGQEAESRVGRHDSHR